MTQLSYREAVTAAIAQEMRRDENVLFIGEDVAAAGGVFKTTQGLLAEFGETRVRDTPISEQAILGAVAGAAMTGLKQSARRCKPPKPPGMSRRSSRTCAAPCSA